VLFLTAKAARSWEVVTNQRVREGVERWPNAVLADWHAVGSAHPEYFTKDGIHLNKAGQNAYAALIRQTLQ
jgi:lysophospholipase L1-like esterase